MKAAVLNKFNTPLELMEYPRPAVGEGEALVRMTVAGVCGSDVHMWMGEDPRIPLPIILGHEGIGVVEEIGGVEPKRDLYGRELRPGDPVIWDRAVVCGKCYFCAVKKLPNMCVSRWVYGINKGCADPPHLRGCYAEHILLDRKTKLISLANDRDIDPAAFVTAGCSGATAANAVALADIRIGDSALVQGAGPLGLYLVALAKRRGAGKVVVVEGVESRIELAKRLGADLVLDYTSTTHSERRDAVMSITNGLGVDAAFEAVGRPEPVVEGIEMVRAGGCYVSVGTAVPAGTVPIDLYAHIVRKQLRLQGAWTNDTRHICEAVELVRSHHQVFREMVTHRYSLDDANDALNSMLKREAIKSAIVF